VEPFGALSKLLVLLEWLSRRIGEDASKLLMRGDPCHSHDGVSAGAAAGAGQDQQDLGCWPKGLEREHRGARRVTRRSYVGVSWSSPEASRAAAWPRPSRLSTR
jgi:hypothetical protein